LKINLSMHSQRAHFLPRHSYHRPQKERGQRVGLKVVQGSGCDFSKARIALQATKDVASIGPKPAYPSAKAEPFVRTM